MGSLLDRAHKHRYVEREMGSGMSQQNSVGEQLNAWAYGDRTLMAAVYLLSTALDGRFITTGWPWVATNEYGGHWLDGSKITAETIGGLSGGEKRILWIVASLLEGTPVDLRDVLTGLDSRTGRHVIRALGALAGVSV